jgi:lysophospholipase L1-like esterase
VLIGMSYCAEWNLTLPGNNLIINKGVKWDLTDGMVKRFTKDVLTEKPDFVLIWGFSNDITTGDRLKITEIHRNIKKNIEQMVSTARQLNIIPILGTQLTISYKKTFQEFLLFLFGKLFDRQSYTDFANRQIASLNVWMKKYAAENKILLLELEEQLGNRWGFRKLKYTRKDGSHVTKGGYERLTDYARPILLDYLSTGP